VQVVASREPRCAAAAELLVHFDVVARRDPDLRQMRIEGLQAHAVVDDYAIAVDAEPAGVHDAAAVRRVHGRRDRRREIEAEVDLVVDFLSLVDVGALIGEAGFDGRVDQLLERPAPEDFRRRLRGEGRDRLAVQAAQLAIDREV
jgi:hypothetical protein